MSQLNQQWSNLNPPPTGPLIPGSIKLRTIDVGEGDFRSHWPTKVCSDNITTHTTLDFSKKNFNYSCITVNSPITLIINNVPRGHQFVFEVLGASTLTLSMDGYSVALTAGTYLVILFSDALKYSEFTNPTAL